MPAFVSNGEQCPTSFEIPVSEPAGLTWSSGSLIANTSAALGTRTRYIVFCHLLVVGLKHLCRLVRARGWQHSTMQIRNSRAAMQLLVLEWEFALITNLCSPMG